MIKVIYVAGKLTGPNNYEIMQNVRRAEEVGMEVVKAGAYPAIPHANTGMTFWGVGDEAFWYKGTLELLRRCDAVITVPGWQDSKGAVAEVREASLLKMPIFETARELRAWLAKQAR